MLVGTLKQPRLSFRRLAETSPLNELTSRAKFDYQKACWFNSEYLKNYSREDKLRAILSIFPSAAERSEQEVELVFDLSSERIQFKQDKGYHIIFI